MASLSRTLLDVSPVLTVMAASSEPVRPVNGGATGVSPFSSSHWAGVSDPVPRVVILLISPPMFSMMVETRPAPEVTEALLLLRLTSKVSSVSAPASELAPMEKLSSWAPTSRSLPPMLVAVRVMAPLAPLLRPLRVTPVAAVSDPATRAAKSVA